MRTCWRAVARSTPGMGNRELKERSSSCLGTLYGSHESPRAGTVRENQSRPWGTDPSYRQRRTLIDRIRKALRHQKEGYLTMNGNI